MDKVCVFMSTYNGEEYLGEQIDSILQQENVEVMLYIRDDGSCDKTLQIIETYIKQGRNIIVKKGENVGFQKSFAIISHESEEADYYAFADQDDVWMPNKLSHAIGMLKPILDPALYGGNILITDASLQNEKKWVNNDTEFEYQEHKIKHYYALGYTMYACSMVWNRKLQILIEKYMPKYFVSHDVYLTMLTGAVGYFVVDKEAMIYHRVHGNNAAGIENNLFKRIKKGYRLYWGKQRRRLSKVAKEIIENYSDCINREKPGVQLLHDIAKCPQSWKNRWNLFTSIEIKLFNGTSRFYIFCLIITNRL